MSDQPVRARIDDSGRQVAEVTIRGGYVPTVILARPGLPIRLVFRRDDDDVCTERVIFSPPRVERRIAAFGTTTIDLPGRPPGEVRFTCGMGRYRGRIEVEADRPTSIVARVRSGAARMREPLRSVLAFVDVGPTPPRTSAPHADPPSCQGNASPVPAHRQSERRS